MHRKLFTKVLTTFVFLLIVSNFLTALPISKVLATDELNQIVPGVGPVGTEVIVYGQISTLNGSYKVFFDNIEVKAGIASQYDVTDTFVVPNSTAGGHPIRIQDVTTGNYSGYLNFTVQTRYILKAVTPTYPKQLQEGDNVTVIAAITGGDENLIANITVKDPANVNHISNVTILTDQNGFGQINKTYPTDFDGNPHTFYTGIYDLSLETSVEIFAIANFTIGITDSVEYNRFQKVNVKALNYTSDDILRIMITFNEDLVFESPPQNASSPLGMITTNWTIPANASLGSYTVNVTKIAGPSAEKVVQDHQFFEVISKFFSCEVKTLNLDNEPVEGISVEANSPVISQNQSAYTNENGVAVFNLEAANYTFTAVLNNTEVGSTAEISLSQNLTDALSLNMTASLAHIKISSKDVNGIPLPFITIKANFTHTTRQNLTTVRWASTETNIDGIAIFRNLFINTNYTLTSSRYGETYDMVNINLTSTRWFNTTVPTYELIVKALDKDGTPLQNAQVKVYDWGIGLSGLKGTGNTDVNGFVTLNLTFGRYLVRVYKELLLNETTTYVTTQPTNFSVYCRLYNLSLTVNIVDYFGQGISNANVTITREGTHFASSNTGGNGIAEFTELVGGEYRVLVYIADKLSRSSQLYLEGTKSLNVRLAELVSIGGFITETAHFVTVLLIVVLIAAFLLVLFYRRLKFSS